MKLHNSIVFLALLSIATLTSEAAPPAKLSVETDFEGASARIIEIDQEKSLIRFMPGGDPERGWPAWWYYRVEGLSPGQKLTLTIIPSTLSIPQGHPGAGKPLSSSWSMPERATWSSDGVTWKHSEPGRKDTSGMTYELIAPGSKLWVAWGPPQTPAMANRWLEVLAKKHDFIETFKHATTLEGRDVRGIRVASGEKPIETRPVIWVHARQHAWESGSSWVARGVGEWLVGDSEKASWTRENCVTYLVPIMDVDRTATGDGGKESDPHDHNRDWSDEPHYPEVAAAQQKIKTWSAVNRLAVFVDLHNPGANDKQAFFYIAPDEAIEVSRRPRRSQFLETVFKTYDGTIPMTRKTRSTGPSYHPLWYQISGTWVTQNSNRDAVAVCLETPWNTPNSTTEGYHTVGASLMKGIATFLQEDEKPKETE